MHMSAASPLLEKALAAKRESKSVEFKEKFDTTQNQDWCETIKDIVAVANSGGGCILFGVDNDGSRAEHGVDNLLHLDPADVTNRIGKYAGDQAVDFELTESTRDGFQVFALIVNATATPIVFTKPGTYETVPGKQKTAFSQGTVYFRHGAKSEPANSGDLSAFVSRALETTRKSWLGNIRKVVEAPHGTRVEVLPPGIIESSSRTATPIRIVDDPSAPAYRKIDPDTTHPHRLKDVVELVNRRLTSGRRVSSFVVQSIRRAHAIDRKANFFYHSKFASPQYSESFVDWLVENIDRNPEFISQARQRA
jgi:hypothetical protein